MKFEKIREARGIKESMGAKKILAKNKVKELSTSDPEFATRLLGLRERKRTRNRFFLSQESAKVY